MTEHSGGTNKIWRVAIARDTAVPSLGLHGLHVACCGLPNVKVVGFFDSKADDLTTIMAATGAGRHYRDYIQMLDEETPDLVILCSRHPNDHFPQIREAANRGIHIYCEKPMTVNLEEADAVIALMQKTGIRCCMAHPARYASTFLTMKKMIDDGTIGRPLTIHGRGKSDHRGGGEDMMVLGTHILDLQSFFFGNPKSVYAEIHENGQPIHRGQLSKTVEPIGPTAGDHIFASFLFPNDVRGIFESRRGLVSPGQSTQMGVCVIGTTGTLSLRFDDHRDADLLISRSPLPPDADAHYEKVDVPQCSTRAGAAPLDESLLGRQTPRARLFLEANRNAILDLIRSIDEDRQPVSNPYNARLALEIIYGVYESHLSARTIHFPLTRREHPLLTTHNDEGG